MGEIGSE